jgi:guanylate kinase
MAAPGVLIIVASPSGGGKTTVIRHAIDRLAERGIPAHFSVSHTTRAPRPSEVDGRDYHFVDRPTFERMASSSAFLEWAEYAGNLYGTSNVEVLARLERGEDVFLDIEVQGANQVKTSIPDAVKVFLFPPSYEVLKERLHRRRQDQPEAIRQRLRWAMRELSVAGEFDYAIINDRLEEAVDAVVGVCLAEHHRMERMRSVLHTIRSEFQHALDEDFAHDATRT